MTSERGEGAHAAEAARLVFFHQGACHPFGAAGTETRFEPIESGRRVSLERGGWERVAPHTAMRSRNLKRWGWASILTWRADWAFWRSSLRITDQPRL